MPGHTEGTLVFLDRAARVVYSGDACNLNTLLNLPGSTSIARYRESLLHFKAYQGDFDVMYGGERDAEADAAFAEACEKGGNVITAANLVYRLKMTARDGGFTMDPDHIERVEYPYDALRRVSSCGFANTLFDKDQFVRRALLFAEHDGETLYSLPAEAALRLSEISG